MITAGVVVIVCAFAAMCIAALLGAYWVSERYGAHTNQAWDRALAIQDEAWKLMNQERGIWTNRMEALSGQIAKLTELNMQRVDDTITSTQRRIAEAHVALVRDVSRAVGDVLSANNVGGNGSAKPERPTEPSAFSIPKNGDGEEIIPASNKKLTRV